MTYNIYKEHYYGATNFLNYNKFETGKLIENISFYNEHDVISYFQAGVYFRFVIFTNNYTNTEIALWDYCLKNNLYEYCQAPKEEGGIVITPKFLELFGEDCTYEIVKKNIMAF